MKDLIEVDIQDYILSLQRSWTCFILQEQTVLVGYGSHLDWHDFRNACTTVRVAKINPYWK